MDRRIQKTQAAIVAAFEELLAAKRYEQITVQDIIDRANIGRSTFYAHFETKDALLELTCRELFAHVFAARPEQTHDFSGEDSLGSRLTHILCHLRDDRQHYDRLLSCASADLFWTYFQAQFRRLIDCYGLSAAAAARGLPEDFYSDFYCGAFIEAVKWWFRQDLRLSPAEVAGYFQQVTGVGPAAGEDKV